MELDPRLRDMLDHHEIRALLAVYCHGCDRADPFRMASIYAPESWDDHGPAKMDGRQFAHQAVAGLNASSDMCSHQLGQSLIRVEGDEAGAETYFIATLRRTLDDGRQVLDHMGGRYVDQLRREGGAWEVRHRVCVRDWSVRLAIEKDWQAGQPWVQGERSGADASFAALGLTHSVSS